MMDAGTSHEQYLRSQIDAVQHDLRQALTVHARNGVGARILLHSLTEVLGSLMNGESSESTEARAECARLVQALELLVAPTPGHVC
ncbi:MAG TPA: hypothetical protein VNJ02_13370 [Vicinamibacterales bacterium]|nr:hypothetical protein [Vicinamibacterales bacterium]